MYYISKNDAITYLQEYRSESVDLLITDPPYESIEKYRKIGTTTRLKQSKSSSNAWFQTFPNKKFEPLLEEIYRVLKKNTHFYLFCDVETMFVVKPIAEKVGFKFWKPLIWDKMRIGMGYHYRARYELILFFEKGKRKLNNLSTPDILQAKRGNSYPAIKPVSILSTLINQSSNPGELVCDPFMGSGSTGAAAIMEHRYFVGCDIAQNAVDITSTRLRTISDNLNKVEE
jgi:site-specific DNA-methyltransferase (adenine-specific)